MKRIQAVWPEIISFANLQRATARAAHNKRKRRNVALFLSRLEPELFRLQDEFESGTYRPGGLRRFTIHDPKTREICAAPFRDRVAQHAVIDVLEPLLDRSMVPQSYACRRGKGQHRAIRYAQRQLRKHAYFLKLDVRGYFASISRSGVRAMLTQRIADERCLRLCLVMLEGAGGASAPKEGLPIGMLSSQCWANLYLDHLDHELVDHQGSAVPDVTGYVRYMDDFALFAETKPTLHAAHDYVRDALGLLGLELKTDATLLAPARQGLPFLGFLVHRGTLRVRPANKRRIRVRLRARMKAAQRGEISEEQLARSAAASCEHLRHANTKGMRRHWFGQHDVNG